jgi:hypothetical protein
MTATTATAQQLEIAHIDATGRTGARYRLAAADFTVGEVVETHAQGKVRLAVVVKVGRTRVEVSWTTPTEIANAAKYGREPIATSKSVGAEYVGKRDDLNPAAPVDEAPTDAAPAEPVVEPETTVDEAAELAVTAVNREAWLTAAVELMRPLFAAIDVELPETVRVSCGFPGGKSPAKTIGQCWYTADDKVAQVFVSPILVDPVDVLGVLVHELIHAWDRGQSGHAGAFRACAKRVGLTGKMTATTVGDELREQLAEMVGELGGYPHARLNLIAAAEKKQGTRMLKVECPACGYTLRTTAKWLEVGVPTCPCGTEMEAAA